MKGRKGKHKSNHFTSASTINNSVIAETKKKTMNSFLTVMSMGECQGSERETQQCGCECFLLSPVNREIKDCCRVKAAAC